MKDSRKRYIGLDVHKHYLIAVGVDEERIVTDLHEVFGQDMLQEAVDESFRAQSTAFFRAGLGIAIAKGHTIMFQLEEAVVAQGDTENVGGEILQRIQTRARRVIKIWTIQGGFHAARSRWLAKECQSTSDTGRFHTVFSDCVSGRKYRCPFIKTQ